MRSEVVLEDIRALYNEALELKRLSRNFVLEWLTAQGIAIAAMKALGMELTILTPLISAIIFLAMLIRWVRARKRLEEIRKEISNLEEKILGSDPMAKQMDFDTKMEIIQIILVALFTVLFYLAAYYSP